jgi:thiamine-phosphate diphosphorylase
LSAGLPALQFRESDLGDAEAAPLAAELLELCRRYGAAFFVNGRPWLARELGADGLHLPTGQQAPPLWRGTLSISAHNGDELARAASVGATFALLSPLFPTRSHPEAPALGTARFEELVAASPVPVLALGGVGPGNAAQARRAGAHGVAAIDALLDTDAPDTAVTAFRAAWGPEE